MLITRAPVRISLAGGGTDLAAYYNQFGGVVINTTIDKYFYVFLRVYDGDSLQIASSDYSTFYRQDPDPSATIVDAPIDGTLGLPRTILNYFGIARGLSMFLASEIPPGTGLGSSSTVTVAIIKATLVVAYFMHLVWDWGKVGFMIIPALILGAMMAVVLYPDIVAAWKRDAANAALAMAARGGQGEDADG